jgi:hypothetical protein
MKFGRNLIINISELVCKLHSTQNFQYYILLKNKRRQRLLVWNLCPSFCLFLSNKQFGRITDALYLCVTEFTVQSQKQFIYQLFSWITENKINMLLIIILVLIANLVFVCESCDFGPSEVTNYDIFQVLNWDWY